MEGERVPGSFIVIGDSGDGWTLEPDDPEFETEEKANKFIEEEKKKHINCKYIVVFKKYNEEKTKMAQLLIEFDETLIDSEIFKNSMIDLTKDWKHVIDIKLVVYC